MADEYCFESDVDEEIGDSDNLPGISDIGCLGSPSQFTEREIIAHCPKSFAHAETTSGQATDLRRSFLARKKTTAKEPHSFVLMEAAEDSSSCKISTFTFKAMNHRFFFCQYPLCESRKRRKWQLQEHVKKMHHGPFFCGQCGVIFNNRPSLHRHTRDQKHFLTSNECSLHRKAAVKSFCTFLIRMFVLDGEYLFR